MLKTEAEARRCQCRHANWAVMNGRPTFINCQASDCMSWRWAQHTKLENREQRPVGFCGRDLVDPILHDFTASGMPKELPGEESASTTGNVSPIIGLQ